MSYAHDHHDFNVKTLNTGELGFISAICAVYIACLVLLHMWASDLVRYGVYVVFGALYFLAGRGVLISSYENAKKLRIFDDNFLVLGATIAAFVIGYYEEAVAVMIFVRLGDFLYQFATQKSHNSISGLFTTVPQSANLLVDGDLVDIPAKDLRVDQTIMVRSGESVPVDCEIMSGSTYVDLSALSGESDPRFFREGDCLKQGHINLDTPVVCRVTKTYQDSSISTIIRIVQETQSKKAKTERFIIQFAKVYTPVVFGICLFISLACPYIFGGDLSQWVYRGLVVLMISCPCALVISIPMSYFSAIGVASKHGILIKGPSFIDALNNIRFMAFDKTGTLTNGEFELIDVNIVDKRYDEDFVLSITRELQNHSSHPIARAFAKVQTSTFSHLDSIEEVKAHGMKAKLDGRDVLVGSSRFLTSHGVDVMVGNANTYSEVFLSIDGVLVAVFLLRDNLKPDTVDSIRELKSYGVDRIHILSGDGETRTRFIADKLGCDFDADLTPTQKKEVFEALMLDVKSRDRFAKCGFVGDGVNDSIVLKISDVGFSIGANSSDLSKQSSDVIFMQDSISQITKAIDISHKTRSVVWQNIVFAISAKAAFVVLGISDMAGLWQAVLGDVGITVLTLLNTFRIFRL